MEAKSNNGSTSERSSRSTSDSKPGSPDEITVFAQEYFSSDFPNSQRLDCPIEGTLSALLSAGKIPDDKLRAHLFGCSECFREYRTAVLARDKHPAHVVASSWSHRLAEIFKRFPAPIYASAIALVLLSLVSLYFWRGRDGEHIARTLPLTPEVASSSPSPAERSSPVGPHSPAPAANPVMSPASPQRPDEFNQGELLAMNTVAVDLEEFSALRGTEESARVGQSIKLTSPRTRLKLKFAEGSPAGRYSISIVNAAGEALVTTKADSSNGIDLNAVLNLQNISSGRYLLRLTRAGEAPGYYPVIVEK